jgi:acid stress chaperone HdeB
MPASRKRSGDITYAWPSGSQWLHEIKHDGFRIIARKSGAQVRLYKLRRTKHDSLAVYLNSKTGRRRLDCAGWLALAAMVCSAPIRSTIMHPKLIVTGLVLCSVVLATASSQAQVIVDVSKITCDQYVHAKIATPLYLAAWISGYYNAKRDNLIVDLQTLEENVSKVQNYCYDEKNFKVPVMKAVERVLGGRK